MRRATWAVGVGGASILLTLAGCGDGIGSHEARLKPVLSCGELEETIRKVALREMEAALDQNLEQALKGQRCDYGDADRNGMPMPSAAGAAGESSSSSGGATQVSGTNNQVAGVDEADFIKNDNKYFYLAANGAFRIIQTWPPSAAKEIAKVAVEGTPTKLFVQGDRALVYSSLTSTGKSGGWGSRACTYGYNCSFTGDGNPTKISIFDISNRAAPILVRELRLSGSYLNARRIGSGVHTVLSAPGVKFPNLASWPQGLASCSKPVNTIQITIAFDELREKNRKIILETPLATIVPSVSDRILGAGGAVLEERDNLLGSCRGFFEPSRAAGGAFTTLLSLDLQSQAPVATSTIVSEPGAVYASPTALYVAVPQQKNGAQSWYASLPSATEATLVHKFLLENGPVSSTYYGSGLVKGRVLNQFAIDEHNGNLRLATTTGHLPSKDVHSTLSVLGSNMRSLGVLDKLAPGEDIRSVRFDGARGFVVTFKKTDPLFVFDLSNPTAPRTLGELKIPGFSTYMHLLDSTHLLTIGYDANDQGSFAWFTGVMLQIFDVSNPQAPTLAYKEVIGTRGSSSEALTNHLAFTYFAPKQLLALPITVCEGGSGSGSYGTTMSFSGLMVYNVTTSTGFKLTGKVAHGKVGASCNNWWTNASSTVKRSIVMDDYVFSITDELIKANHLANLPLDVSAISIK